MSKALRWLRGSRGAVAVMYAVTAPLLIASTGLAVDVGYWYQQQTSLQSAADAAALAAAQGAVAYNISNASDTTTYAGDGGLTFATAAANSATANKYRFASTGADTITLTGTYTTGPSTSATTSFTATVTAPRGSFFSAVRGLGLAGLPSGRQSATATVQATETLTSGRNNGGCTAGTACYCGDIGGNISVTGAGFIKATNCGIYGGGTLSTSGSSEITGANVATGQTSVGGLGNGYIGTGTAKGGTSSGVQYNQTAPTNYLANMGAPPGYWPAMPSIPSVTYSAANLTDPLNLAPGHWNNLSSLRNSANTFNYGTTTGVTYVSGGIGTSGGDGTVFNGSTYNIGGGIDFGSCWSNSAYTTLNGSYYNVQGSGSTYAAILGCNTISVGSSPVTSTPSSASEWNQFYFKGGFELSGSASTITMASGLYEFSTYSSTGGAPAFNTTGGGTSPSITVGTCSPPPATGTGAALACATMYPGTYFFNGGMDILAGYQTIYFMPGIYYIENGTLNLGSGANIVGKAVTFVLENNASFTFNGSATINMSAPTLASDPNCVSPSSYPESNYSGSGDFPYDGTNGHGLCDVVIYQASSDTAADTIDEGAASSFTGAIYTPEAPVTISGSGALSVTSSGFAGLTAASLNDSGSGAVTLTENPPDTGTSGGSSTSSTSSSSITSAVYLLVN